MDFTLIGNGIDSLQKGYKKLEQCDELYISKPDEKKERYFHLKDAVLSIHHGVEILMKHILSYESEYLIYAK